MTTLKSLKIPHLPAILLVVAGVFLRLLFLGKNDLWNDEAASFIFSWVSPVTQNPPFYNILLKGWISFFGSSEFSLRLPSVIFSSGSLIVLYLFTLRLFDRPTALVALLLCCLSPFQLWYAQEARSYTLILLLGLSGTYLLYLFFEKRKKIYLAGYLALATLAFYTNYIFPALFIAQLFVFFWLFKDDKKIAPLLLSPFILAGLFFLPGAKQFFAKIMFIMKGFWIPTPIPSSLLVTLENFILGYSGTTDLYWLIDVVLILLLVPLVIYGLFKKNNQKTQLIICLFLWAFPTLLVYTLSVLFASFYLDRSLIVLTPYFYTILALGITRLNNKKIRTVFVGALILLLAIGDYRYFSGQMFEPASAPKAGKRHHTGTYLKKPFKPLVHFLKQNMKADDYLLFGYLAPFCPLVHYLGYPKNRYRSTIFYVYDTGVNNSDYERPYQEVLGYSTFHRPMEEILSKIKREKVKTVYFLGGDWPRDGQLDENSQKVKEFLDKNLKLINARDFDGVELFTYENLS
jgi:4-amino-4-deoxy-L-arabinose transferase-like glycosyltransferase